MSASCITKRRGRRYWAPWAVSSRSIQRFVDATCFTIESNHATAVTARVGASYYTVGPQAMCQSVSQSPSPTENGAAKIYSLRYKVQLTDIDLRVELTAGCSGQPWPTHNEKIQADCWLYIILQNLVTRLTFDYIMVRHAWLSKLRPFAAFYRPATAWTGTVQQTVHEQHFVLCAYFVTVTLYCVTVSQKVPHK